MLLLRQQATGQTACGLALLCCISRLWLWSYALQLFGVLLCVFQNVGGPVGQSASRLHNQEKQYVSKT